MIIARAQKKLFEVYLDLEEETSKLGMEINKNKTKYMVTSTYKHRRIGIYELEIKLSKQFRASSTWEISLATLTVITNA